MGMQVLKTRHYQAGYEVRTELHDGKEYGGREFIIRSAYTPSGDYIGDPSWAFRLCRKRGIRPEKASPAHCVCSIGFCEKEQKWYGWSHRAIFGFGIGDVVKEGDCVASSGWSREYLKDHPEADKHLPVGFRAETLEDAKKMAEAFAESVS